MSKREFRTTESIHDEQKRRNQISRLLAEKGFRNVRDTRKKLGSAESQTIDAIAPNGEQLTMRVKLGWRSTGTRHRKNAYSAVQLIANVRNDDWLGALNSFVERAVRDGVTHFLLVQSNQEEIVRAALIRAEEIVDIWEAQYEKSNLLLRAGKLGRRKKNHAKNGSSPTLWLEDDMAPEVVNQLWDRNGVEDLVMRAEISQEAGAPEQIDDTFADLNPDYSGIGSDTASSFVIERSYFKRDRRVRDEVLKRSNGICEREGCGVARDYPGFLDVHHIWGIKKSDRVWNCVAICPNCHREAHFSPERDQINKALQIIAEAKSRKRNTHDPLLALIGSGRDLWANEHADEYVNRLREG